jgi:MOSC domain-containing protein YiiM
MSLSEEKMMILKMLQEGKISTEDAAKLLEALERGAAQQPQGENTSYRQQRPQPNYNDEIAKMRERIHEWKNDFKKNYNQKDFDRW